MSYPGKTPWNPGCLTKYVITSSTAQLLKKPAWAPNLSATYQVSCVSFPVSAPIVLHEPGTGNTTCAVIHPAGCRAKQRYTRSLPSWLLSNRVYHFTRSNVAPDEDANCCKQGRTPEQVSKLWTADGMFGNIPESPRVNVALSSVLRDPRVIVVTWSTALDFCNLFAQLNTGSSSPLSPRTSTESGFEASPSSSSSGFPDTISDKLGRRSFVNTRRFHRQSTPNWCSIHALGPICINDVVCTFAVSLPVILLSPLGP